MLDLIRTARHTAGHSTWFDVSNNGPNTNSTFSVHTMAIFEVFEDTKKEFRWRLKASNGKIIATGGEGYVAKADCEHGIEL